MNWNTWIRQIHRWLSIVFTVGFLINLVAWTSSASVSGSQVKVSVVRSGRPSARSTFSARRV